MTGGAATACGPVLEARALEGIGPVGPGDDLGRLVVEALARNAIDLADGDVVAVASKIVSRAENRFVDLSTVEPGGRARSLAHTTGHDPRLVELVLGESSQVSRAAPGVLVVRHRLGLVSANAGIDASNAEPPAARPGSGPWVLLLPERPDESAERIRRAVRARWPAEIGVAVTDSLGRPFRLGTVGVAVGLAGLPALWDRRGETDLCGRALGHTVTALADQVAAAADLVAGQAAEGRPVVLVRGLAFRARRSSSTEIHRPPEADLYLRAP